MTQFCCGDVANQPDGQAVARGWSRGQCAESGNCSREAMLGLNSQYRDVRIFGLTIRDKVTDPRILCRVRRHCVRVMRQQVHIFLHEQSQNCCDCWSQLPQDVAVARRLMQKGMVIDPQRLLHVDSLATSCATLRLVQPVNVVRFRVGDHHDEDSLLKSELQPSLGVN